MRNNDRLEVAVVVTPNSSLLSALLLIEPLRAANRLSGSSLFEHYFASVDGKDVKASNGLVITVQRALTDVQRPSMACLVASYDQPRVVKNALFKGFRRFERHGSILCAVDIGVVLLAEAGLVKDRRVSVHWEMLPAFLEKWSEIRATEELYSIDRNLMTCGGHTASLDMMMAFITERLGPDLTRVVSNEMLTSGFRSPATPQRHLAELEPWDQHPLLGRLIRKMNEQIEQAPKIDELTRTLKISRRQLEYLSQQYLNCSPGKYFLSLRLNRSRQLLLHTDSSIATVAAASGFSSTSTFSRSFQRHFGVSPSSYRLRWRTTLSRPYIQSASTMARDRPTRPLR
ncbi:MAG: GlxA family transcriptional regulator [Parvibaculaceae bacterium]